MATTADSSGILPVMEKTCNCHGVPLIWNKDAKMKAGGFWRCRVKLYVAQRRYMRGKGYVTNRRRHLLARRERIVNQLEAMNGSE